MILIKRVYQKPEKDDGERILVDRLWPRGVIKDEARVDLWLKEIAPSNELRKWFNHDPKKWNEFRRKYNGELKMNNGQLDELKKKIKKGTVTLLFAAKDEEHNNAVVLKEFLES